ncbi:MAG TPA: TauD/TfdA family dioxygenase [Alphaproteobacteria bacterium]|nr:TauD/TfdA family dioxygenase [Alphaproteobacteria bacterium]
MSNTLSITPLSPTFGAAISGIDLSHPLDAAARADILAAWRKHLVLIFRGQTLSPEALLDFARGFGRLDLAPPFDQQQSSLPGYPEIAVVSNVEEKGAPIGGLGAGELAWHSDMTYRADPPEGCVLFAREIPAAGGNTHFLNMAACLDSLPADIRAAIGGRRLVHDSRYTSAGTERVAADDFAKVNHPLVITEPLSGRQSLLLGRRRQSAVIGLNEAQGKALLDTLWEPADHDRFAITHEWRPGDVVMWGNIAVMHRRDAFNSRERRVLLRAQIAALN